MYLVGWVHFLTLEVIIDALCIPAHTPLITRADMALGMPTELAVVLVAG